MNCTALSLSKDNAANHLQEVKSIELAKSLAINLASNSQSGEFVSFDLFRHLQ